MSPDDGTVTLLLGSLDEKIWKIDTISKTSTHSFQGHKHGVISLCPHANNPNEFFSGSWDGTARHWSINPPALLDTLEGHTNGVNVSHHASGCLVTTCTGTQDPQSSTLHVWRQSSEDGRWSVTQTLNPHRSQIRWSTVPNLVDPLSPVVTCGNDGQVTFVDVNQGGDVVKGVVGRVETGATYLLTCASFGTGGGVAVGDVDGGCHVVEGGIVAQTMRHPGTVWAVLGRGFDVVTACQDGYVRTFTRDPARVAGEEEVGRFDGMVEEEERKRKRGAGTSEEDLEKYDIWEDRTPSDKGHMSVKVFNKGGEAWAAQWDDDAKSWVLVGQVTGQSDSGTIDGTKFDWVLPIEHEVAGGGVRKLQIGYNNGDNPFVVAQRFIDENQMDQNDLAQIADYIIQRTGQKKDVVLGQVRRVGPC